MTMRCWDELRAAGGELAERAVDYDEIIDIISRVIPRFELSVSEEHEAVHALLTGLRGALSAAAFLSTLAEQPAAAK